MKRRRIKLGDAIMIAGERAILKRFIRDDDDDDHPSAIKGWLWEKTGIPGIQRGFQRWKNAFKGNGFQTNEQVENRRLRKENAALKQSQQPPKPKQPQQAKPAKPIQAPKPSQPARPAQAPKPASPAQPQHDDFYDLIW